MSSVNNKYTHILLLYYKFSAYTKNIPLWPNLSYFSLNLNLKKKKNNDLCYHFSSGGFFSRLHYWCHYGNVEMGSANLWTKTSCIVRWTWLGSKPKRWLWSWNQLCLKIKATKCVFIFHETGPSGFCVIFRFTLHIRLCFNHPIRISHHFSLLAHLIHWMKPWKHLFSITMNFCHLITV